MSIFRDLGIREGKGRLKEELAYNLAGCYVLLEKRIERFLSPYGLSPVKMNVMMMVKHVGKDQGLSQADLSKRMIVTAGNVTRLIDRLQKDKFVERAPLANDRRVNLIKITKIGACLLDKVWPLYKKEIDRIIPLPKIDIIKTVASLDSLRRSVQRSNGEGKKHEAMSKL